VRLELIAVLILTESGNIPSGTCEEIGFETKPAARNGTDAQSSAILSSAFISVLTTAALLLA